MYRNLALMSDITSFAYQAKPQHVVDNRQADYEVDVNEVAGSLKAAVRVVSNNFPDNWYNHDQLGKPYNVSVTNLSVQRDCTKQM